MTTIKLTDDQIKLLEIGNKMFPDISNPKKHYYFLSFWFESTEEEGVYKIHSLENMPEYLKDEILKQRER